MRTDYSIKTRTHCVEILIIWEIKLYWYVFSVELTRVQLILNLNIIYMEYLNMRLKNMYVNIKQRKKL